MNEPYSLVETSYRTFYGKLFSALFSQFGANYVSQIEDALQNAFYKSLKNWGNDQMPLNKENWLFIVARNDVLNQIKKENQLHSETRFESKMETEKTNEDLRLKTILYLSQIKNGSPKAKVVFILKNIFGLDVKEISVCTLLSQDAIYKSINRVKKDIQRATKEMDFELAFEQASETDIAIVEEILYAVFTIGFDSFNEKINSIINEDLCLEALALAKILLEKFGRPTTRNLLALFSFHLARIPAKVDNGKIISFFEQDRTKWNSDFIQLGFHYLQKPETLDIYYVEALIASKHMTAKTNSVSHWNEISTLYELMLTLSNSPIIRLNLCYCLSMAERMDEAKALLKMVEQELPHQHIYLALVKATLFKDSNGPESKLLLDGVVANLSQKIRREYILEKMSR